MTRLFCPKIGRPGVFSAFFGAVFGLLGSGQAMAHPDYWVTVKYLMSFDETSLTEVKLDWEFDVFYSNEALNRYDLDRDRTFSEQEAEALREALFAPLASKGYFVRVVAGETAQPMRLGTFAPRVEGDRLAISFTLLPETPMAYRTQTVAIATHDKAAYDFTLAETEFLQVDGPFDASCRFRVGDGSGPLAGVPQTVALICQE